MPSHIEQQGDAIKAKHKTRSPFVLMAEDDVDYHLLVRCALEEIGFKGVLRIVTDGAELMDFLCRRGDYEREQELPDLILLDLRMPGKDGFLALREIKRDPSLRHIPVAVLTCSSDEEDVAYCSRFKRCSFTTKPATFQDWVQCIEEILSSTLRPRKRRVRIP